MDKENYDKVMETIWSLAEKGLESLTLEHIAGQSGVPEFDCSPLFPEQKFILLALVTDVKSKVKLPPFSPTLSKDDQFFDAVMAYYDVCQPHKRAIKHLAQDILWSPFLSFSLVPPLQQMANHLTDQYYPVQEESLKVSLQNAAQKLAIQILLLRVFYKWLEDDSFDSSETMAVLDQGIKHISQLSQLGSWC